MANPPSKPPKPPITLGECAAQKVQFEVLCQSCFRRKGVDPRILIPKFGADYRYPNLNGKLKCALCTSSRSQITIVASQP